MLPVQKEEAFKDKLKDKVRKEQKDLDKVNYQRKLKHQSQRPRLTNHGNRGTKCFQKTKTR